MRIHLIAIGGSIMHNLAMTLQKAGHTVTGSDDEIYEPARSRLKNCGLFPEKMGWDENRIGAHLDLIILGMHAKSGNPELMKALNLGLAVQSFPAFIASHTKDKKRVVVAGSHGKTTTTSMIMHVLKYNQYPFDYLVGAQLKGFETMVQLSQAPVAIIEGDEYLSSAIDRVPKIWHYDPDIAIITGVSWDHMNVFPTLDSYHQAFHTFITKMRPQSKVYFDKSDRYLFDLSQHTSAPQMIGYKAIKHEISSGKTRICISGNWSEPLEIFGEHNMKNIEAARLVTAQLGINSEDFLRAITTFEGAARRLQIIAQRDHHILYQDFAHAPSKVAATVNAVRSQFPARKLTACLELHTYSSLNKSFLPRYAHALDETDNAIVFFSPHTLEMKEMPMLSDIDIRTAFGRDDIVVFTDSTALEMYLRDQQWEDHNLLMMSSGTFGGINFDGLTEVS